GPVCYGRGGHAVTVTDANLYLGRLLPGRFLGGRMALNLNASHQDIETLAEQARLDPFRLAEGVLEVAEETMAGALRVVSVQRGHDPREYTLLPFGGAGGLHACALAEKLGIGRILLPAHPGLLSAVGMVLADVIRDYAHSVLWPGDTKRKMIDKAYRPMESNAVQDMAAEGVKLNTVRLERSIDLRYQGQSFEVTVPYTKDFADRFHERHEVLFGYQDLTRPLEIVTLRLRAVAPGPSDDVAMHVEMQPKDEQVTTQPVVFAGEKVECPVYERMHIPLGEYLVGPAVIIEDTATHLIKPGWRLRVDSEHNLALETMSGTEAGASTREPKPFD
ncbi:MAG: hydantoinase/oxoprolinase family protein, partial [Deltaproteobacteria bacterium]|nr:hydantoinase/oxoprolinase family protein [Deltaproteobacteria bacterium]